MESKKKFKIAMVAACPFPANHGSPASIREMSWALSELGHEIHIVTYPFGQKIPVEGVRIHRVGAIHMKSRVTVGPSFQRIFLDFFMILKLYKVVKNEKVDLIHAHNYEGAIIGYIVKKLTGKQLLYNAVNTMIDELPAYDFIRPRFLAVGMAKVLDYLVPRGADFITAVSHGLRSFLIEKGVDGNRILVVPAGVFPEMFEDGDPKKARARLDIKDQALIIYTGTLDRFQRIDYLLKAFKIVADSNKKVVLLIAANVSKPADVRTCQDMIKKLDLEHQVVLREISSLADLKDCLLSGDVAVLPRPSCPGHPVKLLNYMAAGRAIVAFRGSGRGIQDFNNGLLVEDHDWNQLGQKILYLLNNHQLIENLGRNASGTVRDHFDWRKIVKGISVIYEGMTSSRTSGNIVIDEELFCNFIPKEL